MNSMMKPSAKAFVTAALAFLFMALAIGGAAADTVYTPQYEDEIAAYDYMMKKAAGARLLSDDEMEYYISSGGAVVTKIVPRDKEQLTAINPISVRLPDTVGGYPVTGFEVPESEIGRTYVVELVIVPDTVADVWQPQYTHSEVDYVIAGGNNPYLTTAMGAVYDKECTQLLWANLQDPFTLRIPEGVTSIRDYGLNNDFGNVSYKRWKEIDADPVEGPAVNQGGYKYYMNDVWLPSTLTDVGRQYQFHRIVFKVSPDNPVYAASELGCLLAKDGMELLTINYYYIKAPNPLNRFVTIPEGTVTLGRDVLSFSMDELIIPASVKYICFDDDFYWRDVSFAYTVDPGNQTYTSVDGVLFSKDKKTLIAYPAFRYTPEHTYNIPGGVERIASNAFVVASHELDQVLLNTVVVPESVVAIEEKAFHFFDELFDYFVHVPATATDVKNNAFWGDMTVYTPEGSAAWDAAMYFKNNNPAAAMHIIAD